VEEEIVIPEKFMVEQNYPNPFNPATSIKFGIPEGNFVSVRIYNMLGQEVRTLVSGQMNAGTYNLLWDGKDDNGQSVTSGAYIYRVISGGSAITKKMMLLK
jgi:flagellar hook assembly protein FlgD